jgi:hypothetical protein
MFFTHRLRFELGTLANRTLPSVVADGFVYGHGFLRQIRGGNGLRAQEVRNARTRRSFRAAVTSPDTLGLYLFELSDANLGNVQPHRFVKARTADEIRQSDPGSPRA